MAEPTESEVQVQRPTLLRTRRSGVYKLKRDCWGERYETCDDPQTMADQAPDDLWLAPDFVKVPSEQWARIVQLYLTLCDPSNRVVDSKSEVSVVFARSLPDFREWRTFVPKQTVGATSVDADLTKLIDIVTGEELDGFPDGWVHAGSSHSHQTMGAFFSGTDDKNELDVPGLHVVVGEIQLAPDRQYLPLASVVLNHRRTLVPARAVLDVEPRGLAPHPGVFDYVKKHVYVPYAYKGDRSRFHGFDDDWDSYFDHDQTAPDRDAPKDDDTGPLDLAAFRRFHRDRTDAEVPRFQAEVDADVEAAARSGDQAAIRLRIAITAARRQARDLPDKPARTVHRLCDALGASRGDARSLAVVQELLTAALRGEG